MAKEILPTTAKVTVTHEPITGAPAPQMVRIYHKTDGTAQDVFPVDAKEIVAQGEYSYDPADLVHTESPNVYKPVRPETLSEMLPEARQPLDERENMLAEEHDNDPNMSLRGPLADDFPHRAALEAAGYGTYGKARQLIAKKDWHKGVPNIGDRTYGSVEDALKEK